MLANLKAGDLADYSTPRDRNEGNGNAGHEGEEYGTKLPDADKDAIVEYLKTF
ncbi:MAG: hypothetical protein M3463_05325 [Verrucomicrobiota bacterium]|nr:hypothetical protein [Verrucomicrobiota bacterium]